MFNVLSVGNNTTDIEPVATVIRLINVYAKAYVEYVSLSNNTFTTCWSATNNSFATKLANNKGIPILKKNFISFFSSDILFAFPNAISR